MRLIRTLSPDAIRLYVALSYNRQQIGDRRTYIPQSLLRFQTGFSYPEITKAKQKLVDAGLIAYEGSCGGDLYWFRRKNVPASQGPHEQAYDALVNIPCSDLVRGEMSAAPLF
jgi:hypothetical protein